MRVALHQGLRQVRIEGVGLWWQGEDGLRHPVDGVARLTPHRDGIALGEQRLPDGVLFGAQGDESVKVEGRPYSGTMKLHKQKNRLLVVNHVDLESYVAGVVAAETPPDWGVEVKKAQAVAVRTYTMVNLAQSKKKPYDMGRSALTQQYDGKKVDRASREAVEQTRGQVLKKAGKLVTTYYHSACGGHTEPARGMTAGSAGVSGVQDPYCRIAPSATWSLHLQGDSLGAALARKGKGKGGPVTQLRVGSRTSGGQASRVIATVAGEDVSVSGNDFRFVVGATKVRSARFTITPDGEGWKVEGHGFGHGSGLCQWGAEGQARARRTYHQILSFYFPGTRIDQQY